MGLIYAHSEGAEISPKRQSHGMDIELHTFQPVNGQQISQSTGVETRNRGAGGGGDKGRVSSFLRKLLQLTNAI